MSEVEYVIQGYYGSQYGWEDACSEEDLSEAKQRLIEYQKNEPQYEHRMMTRKVERKGK